MKQFVVLAIGWLFAFLLPASFTDGGVIAKNSVDDDVGVHTLVAKIFLADCADFFAADIKGVARYGAWFLRPFTTDTDAKTYDLELRYAANLNDEKPIPAKIVKPRKGKHSIRYLSCWYA